MEQILSQEEEQIDERSFRVIEVLIEKGKFPFPSADDVIKAMIEVFPQGDANGPLINCLLWNMDTVTVSELRTILPEGTVKKKIWQSKHLKLCRGIYRAKILKHSEYERLLEKRIYNPKLQHYREVFQVRTAKETEQFNCLQKKLEKYTQKQEQIQKKLEEYTQEQEQMQKKLKEYTQKQEQVQKKLEEYTQKQEQMQKKLEKYIQKQEQMQEKLKQYTQKQEQVQKELEKYTQKQQRIQTEYQKMHTLLEKYTEKQRKTQTLLEKYNDKKQKLRRQIEKNRGRILKVGNVAIKLISKYKTASLEAE
ncbi:MAG: hypothetical protein ACPLSN_08680 [Dictyoglomus turgidum]